MIGHELLTPFVADMQKNISSLRRPEEQKFLVRKNNFNSQSSYFALAILGKQFLLFVLHGKSRTLGIFCNLEATTRLLLLLCVRGPLQFRRVGVSDSLVCCKECSGDEANKPNVSGTSDLDLLLFPMAQHWTLQFSNLQSHRFASGHLHRLNRLQILVYSAKLTQNESRTANPTPTNTGSIV